MDPVFGAGAGRRTRGEVRPGTPARQTEKFRCCGSAACANGRVGGGRGVDMAVGTGALSTNWARPAPRCVSDAETAGLARAVLSFMLCRCRLRVVVCSTSRWVRSTCSSPILVTSGELQCPISLPRPIVGPHEAWRLRIHEPHRLITAHDRLVAATTALVAHELGHAAGAQWRVSKFGVAEEVQADELAGQMAGTLCTRAELDRAFFHAVGCTSGVSCSHPDPDSRVGAYDRGRAISDRCVPASW